jgi:hypothetical protein
MKKPLNEEFKHMQKLAGLITENQSPELTNEEKVYLENEIEKFLNTSIFNSGIVDNDSPDFSKEERAIQFIIDTLQERISY